jgi:hypothetical protein
VGLENTEELEIDISDDDIEEAEVVATSNVPQIDYEEAQPLKKKKRGAISLKYQKLAEMAARSFPVEIIAKELGMKEKNVYKLIEDNEEVWTEIQRIIASIFAEGDRMLASLRTKALIKLDEQLESPNPDLKDKAIDKILKLQPNYGGSIKEGDRTAIFIGTGGRSGDSGVGMESVDDLILRMRRERGLPMPQLPQLPLKKSNEGGGANTG